MSAERIILKQSGTSRIVPIAVWIFCVLAAADGIIEGSVGFAVRTILVLSAVALATWMVLFSPYLGVDREGVTVLNPARVVTVPFGALIDVRVGGTASIVVRLADGSERKVTSWNAPGVQRRGPTRAAALATPQPSTPEVVAAVDHFHIPWEREHPKGDSAATATITWRWREWLVLAVLIVVNVAIRLR
jgi:hypothetical protein